ncbi:hypothetical protein, partial [Pumilibacter intestinalis]|uniref:hypothetical protein n=1 Tax=Pumilibacter intestinalis TaxID=2941511 RepID=UPI00203AB96E
EQYRHGTFCIQSTRTKFVLGFFRSTITGVYSHPLRERNRICGFFFFCGALVTIKHPQSATSPFFMQKGIAAVAFLMDEIAALTAFARNDV